MKHSLIPTRNAKLYAEYKAGRLVGDLSVEYGLSINTVFSIIAKMAKKDPDRSTGSLEPRIRKLAAQGATRAEIAEQLKIPYHQVCRLIRIHEIKVTRQFGSGVPRVHPSRGNRNLPRSIPPALRVAGALTRFLREGVAFSFTEVAKASGVTREYVGQVYRSLIEVGLVPDTNSDRLAA